MTSRERIQFWGAILGVSGFIYLWSFEFSQLFLSCERDNTPTNSVFGHAENSDTALAGIFYSVTPDENQIDSDVRFYYFHGNGIGLLRYGKVGLNNTESFHYETQADVLSLKFNKKNNNKWDY